MNKLIKLKLILFLVFSTSVFSSENKLNYIRQSIENCSIENLKGNYESRVCEIRAKFLYPELVKNLKEYENFIILHGKTGNGKTSIAKNLSTECGAELIEFENTESDIDKIKTLLNQVIKITKSNNKCIFLLDELDNITDNDVISLLCSFVNENKNNENLLIIGTTNHLELTNQPLKKLSGALIEINYPKLESRFEILKYYSEKYKKLDHELLMDLAKNTNELSRRALKNIISDIRQKSIIDGNVTSKDLKTIIEIQQKAEKIYRPDWKIQLLHATGQALERTVSTSAWLLEQWLIYKIEHRRDR